MKKTRKNFAFETKIVKAAEKRAKKEKRTLTAHLEVLMEQDIKNNS